MTTWKVRNLRLTLFLASEGAAKAGALQFEQLVNEKPESTMRRGDQEFQEGPLGPGRLLMQKQPARLDILFAGFPQPDQPEEPVATLGDFETAFPALRQIAQTVFDDVKQAIRLALGSEMVQSVESSLVAYKKLVDHMRSATFKLDGGQEFMYQMNRPRYSRVIPSLLINRLTRWNASSWQPVRFELGAGVRVLSGPPQIGAVITTDVNTDAEHLEPLPADKVSDLFDELRDLTLEIRDHGDVP
jgi:hypothetical protein